MGASVTGRTGPSIREFLRYYVLAAVGRRRRKTAGIISEIRRRSAGNREFRRSEDLVIDPGDLALVLRQLVRRGLIVPSGRAWALTRAGRSKLAVCNQEKENSADSKDRAARVLLRWMDPRPTRRVLDVGTGEGYLALQLAEKGYRVMGIDSGSFEYSKDSVRTARQAAAARGLHIEFQRVSVGELRHKGAPFDCLVASEAVHCMQDQPRCIRAMYALLKPGGTFLSMDLHVGLKGFLEHGWHAFLALSKEEWGEHLARSGFEEPVFRRVGGYLVVKARKPRRGRKSRRSSPS